MQNINDEGAGNILIRIIFPEFFSSGLLLGRKLEKSVL